MRRITFSENAHERLAKSLYWILWIIVILLLNMAPTEGASPILETPATADTTPPDSQPMKLEAEKIAPPVRWEVDHPLKSPSTPSQLPIKAPPKDQAQRLPKKEGTARPDTYPDSNERGQLRLDVPLKASTTLKIQTPTAGPAQPVALRIMGPVSGLWLQAENEPAIGDFAGLVETLTEGTRNDREKAEKLFEFVVRDIKDWYYPAQGLDLTVEDLSVLIWNFGFGFCYDLGRLQAGLWAQAGLRSRIVGWPQHTVAEVFYDGAWHLYDLQHRSFYTKANGTVASFAELKANPDHFYQNLNSFGLDAIGYPPHHMAHWYGIANPKFEDSQDGPHWRTDKDFRINLRLGETFDILYNQPGPAYHPDSWHQYYGELTTSKDPPWLIQGRQIYAPDFINQPARWVPVTTPSGKPGFAISMENPFIFTEAWMIIPELPGFSKYWVHVRDQTYFGGRLVGGNAVFGKYIEGSNHFTLIVEPQSPAETAEGAGLHRAQIHAKFQMSPLHLPQLKEGENYWPFTFEAGSPHLSIWYLERTPDLEIRTIRSSVPNPRVGQEVGIQVTVGNRGTAVNEPSSLTLFNNVTAFLAETIEKIGTQTIPPLKPGETVTLSFPWIANTRMTWYGQNPYIQLFDGWIDIEGDRPDPNRHNNRLQAYFHLSKEDGSLSPLPGYQPLTNHP